MASNELTERRAHVLMLPLEESGHFNQFVQLLYYLSRYDIRVTVCSTKKRIGELTELKSRYDIRVTVCSTKKRIGELTELKSRGAFKGLDIRFEDVFSESDEAARPRKVGDPPALFRISSDMEAQFKPYMARLMDKKDPDAKPTFMLADFLLNWTEEIADQLNIPRYMMVTSSAWAPLTVLWGEMENWISKQDDLVTLPGLSPLRIRGNIPVLLSPLMNFKNVAGCLCNTFEELEQGIIEAVRTHLQKHPTPSGQVTKFLPVGPMMILPGNSEPFPQPFPDQNDFSCCVKWLDYQSPSSVLYVAFGTQAKLGEETIHEIAHGLEASNVPFLWALKLPGVPELSSVLPPGFLERTEDRGLTVNKYTPQLQILNHPSTGGFMSHCGWNSTVESICAGVPVLAHPMHGDQPVNSRILAELANTGIIIPQIKGVSARDDISKGIKSVMLGEEGLQLRKNATNMKKIALACQEEGGSSSINIQYFVQDILASVVAK